MVTRRAWLLVAAGAFLLHCDRKAPPPTEMVVDASSTAVTATASASAAPSASTASTTDAGPGDAASRDKTLAELKAAADAERAKFDKECKANKLSSCVELGYIIETYDEVPDFPAALALYQKACKGGHMPGCAQEGLMHKYGRGAAPDKTKALALFKKGCDANDPLSCSNLAVMLADGDHIDKDERRAVVLWTKACDGGLALACTNLGYETAIGRSGITKDVPRAIELYKKACDKNEQHGCNLLAFYYEHGESVPQDKLEAFRLFAKACRLGETKACAKEQELRSAVSATK